MFLYFAKFYNYMNNTKYIIPSLVSLFIFFNMGCNSCDNSIVKNITASAKVFRFDSMLYSINKPASLSVSLAQIKKMDPSFYSIYISKLYSMTEDDPKFEETIFNHINSAQNQEIRKRLVRVGVQ